MNKKREITSLFVLALTIIPTLLILSKLTLQFDITDNKIYSLDESTRKILSQYDQPLYIYWWKSDEFQSPQIDLLTDLFSDLSNNSGSDLFAEIKSPSASDKQRLRDLGLLEEQVEITRGSDLIQKLIFSGIEINYLGSTVIIPFITEPGKMEFQIVEALSRLNDGFKKTVAIFPDYTVENPNGMYTLITSSLSKYFNVLSISENSLLTQIPDIMIVPDRKEYSMEELFTIDQTIQSGSPVIFLIDGLDINPLSNDYAVPYDDYSIINRLLYAYGISVGDALISDKNSLYLNSMSGLSKRYNHYNMWFKIDETVDLLWASPIQIRDVEGIETVIWNESSNMSWLNEGETRIEPDDLEDIEIFTGPYPVIVELNGSFKPLFQPSNLLSEDEGTILVIGSTLTFSDLIQSSGSFKNISYLRNTIYKLLGKDQLYKSALQSDQNNLMNVETVLKGKGQLNVLLINLLIVPLSIIILYFILLNRRSRSRKK